MFYGTALAYLVMLLATVSAGLSYFQFMSVLVTLLFIGMWL
jgi:hypothetical protein